MSKVTTKVSVIVPVYNSAEYLRRCIESLVFQSLEDIELIFVNNGSEDQSLEILEQYKVLFPEKVFIYSIEHHTRVGFVRNVGIRHARGAYIAFCDSDDMMPARALEKMYQAAIKNGSDLVIGPFARYKGMISSREGDLGWNNLLPDNADAIMRSSPSVWGKLIRRDLRDRVGFIPDDFSSEDIAYSLMLHSQAKKISYIPQIVYYYINRNNSEVRSIFSESRKEVVDSMRYGLEWCNPSYKDAVAAKCGNLLSGLITKDWVFADHFIAFVKELWPKLKDNVHFLQRVSKYEYLKQYAELPETPMSQIVYLNGFDKGVPLDRTKLIESKVFRGSTDVVVLDSVNCDVSENRIVHDAYTAGDTDFVAKYFALKRIYETGGIYIGDVVRPDAPMSFVRYFPAFFGYLDQTTFTDEVFGGLPGSRVLKLLIDTYQSGSHFFTASIPLRDRMKNMLVAVYDVPLSKPYTAFFTYRDFALFSPDILIVDSSEGLDALFPKMHFTTHIFTGSPQYEGEFLLVKRSTLVALSNNAYHEGTIFAQEKEEPQYKKLAKKLESRIAEITGSRSWRITKPLRLISQRLKGWH